MQLFNHQELLLRQNPFGGLTDVELEQVLVPHFEMERMLALIEDGQPKIIEFLGKKGRGKTSHFRYLHRHLPFYPMYLLDQNKPSTQIEELQSPVIFVDSIFHLGLFRRLRLYRAFETVVLTTHWGRKLEYQFAGKKSYCFHFKGINADRLKKLIVRRIKVMLANENQEIIINDQVVNTLIEKFGDNYRAILNHLFDQYQRTK